MNKSVYPHPIIAREGWPFIALTIGIAIVVALSWSLAWSGIFWLIALFVLQFFRDPPRQVPDVPLAVLAPADGRVVAVEKVQDPYTVRPALKISIFMNVFNVHSNRVPVAGQVIAMQYVAGKFFNAALSKASLENERNVMVLCATSGHIVTVVQVAGLVAKRILCYVKKNDIVAPGQRYGFIRFGSRVDVYLPPDSRPCVALGDKVSATRSILAALSTLDQKPQSMHSA